MKFLKVQIPEKYENNDLIENISDGEWVKFVEFGIESLINYGKLYSKINEGDENMKLQMVENEKKHLNEIIMKLENENKKNIEERKILQDTYKNELNLQIETLKLSQKQTVEAIRQDLERRNLEEIKQKEEEIKKSQITYGEKIKALNDEISNLNDVFSKKLTEERDKMKKQIEYEFNNRMEMAIKEAKLEYSTQIGEKKLTEEKCIYLEEQIKELRNKEREYIEMQKSINKEFEDKIKKLRIQMEEDYNTKKEIAIKEIQLTYSSQSNENKSLEEKCKYMEEQLREMRIKEKEYMDRQLLLNKDIEERIKRARNEMEQEFNIKKEMAIREAELKYLVQINEKKMIEEKCKYIEENLKDIQIKEREREKEYMDKQLLINKEHENRIERMRIQMEEEYNNKKEIAIKEMQLSHSLQLNEMKLIEDKCKYMEEQIRNKEREYMDKQLLLNKEFEERIEKERLQWIKQQENTINSHIVNLSQKLEEITSNTSEKDDNKYEDVLQVVKDLMGKFNDFTNIYTGGTSQQKGDLGENIVYNYLIKNDKYKEGTIRDTSKEGSNGDLRLEYNNIKCLIEIKNKQRIDKSDIDKFHNDIEKQSRNINCALFVSLLTSDIMESVHTEFNYSKVRDIPVIYIGGVLRNINMIGMALQYLERLPNAEVDNDNKHNQLMGFLKMLKEHLEDSRMKIKKRINDITREKISLEAERSSIDKKLDEITTFEDDNTTMKNLKDTDDDKDDDDNSIDKIKESRLFNKKIDETMDWISESKTLPSSEYYNKNFGNICDIISYDTFIDILKNKAIERYQFSADMDNRIKEFIAKEKRYPNSKEFGLLGIRNILDKLAFYVKRTDYIKNRYRTYLYNIERTQNEKAKIEEDKKRDKQGEQMLKETVSNMFNIDE